MYMLLAVLICSLAGVVLGTPVSPRIGKRHSTECLAAGTYIPSLSQCPGLTKRTTAPTSVHDLRPDDFSYALAVGDSITAGAFLRGLQSSSSTSLNEWRGQSYAGGADANAITVPNLIKHYNSKLTGGSVGSTSFQLCSEATCTSNWNATVDQLNGALSGALAATIPHEINDYLVPQVQAKNIPTTAFKYLNFQIGSNDVCNSCAKADGSSGPGSADDFETNIRTALEAIRTKIPNTVVNLLGVDSVQDVYAVTLNQSYCTNHISYLTLSVECKCATTATGRQQMVKLAAAYNQRLVKVAKEYQTANYSTFTVIWQPPTIPLSTYPVQFFSDVDCFHPSLAAHQLMAAGVWNRLVGNAQERATNITWTTNLTYRCLQDSDRIQTNILL